MQRGLTTDLDPSRDILVTEGGGRARLVWYLDFTSMHTRRIRDVLQRSADRFGPTNVSMAVRFLPSGPESAGAEIAARGAIAAAKQDSFWDMHRALFSRPPRYTEALVLSIAEVLDLDLDQLKQDMWSEETDQRLAEDRLAAHGAGVRDTPALFIDGRLYDGAWDETSLIEEVQKPIGVQIRIASLDFFHWAASAGLVLILATLLALLVVNIGWHEGYEHLRNLAVSLSFGESTFSLPLEMWINDGLMALFFLLVGIEIKREIVNGELSDPASAALPIIAALGGMIAPALIYAGINWGSPTVHGWGVPMATDIAFTLGILALLGDRVPTSLKVFVSALAIADDLGAIVVIALFYGEGFELHAFLIAAAIFVVMMGLNRGRIYSRVPYLILGVVMWYFIHESGLHATLAGVLTAAAIPSRRSANIQGVAAQAAAIFDAEMRDPDTPVEHTNLNRLQAAIERLREPGFHLQNALENWSNFLILPLFAFFNTGIAILGAHFSPLHPEALGVIAGLVIGKPLGIFIFVFVAVKLGFARLSSEISWAQLLGAGCLAGVGFTMSIFIGTASFGGEQLSSVKLAILIASSISAVIGSLVLIRAAHPAPAAQES